MKHLLWLALLLFSPVVFAEDCPSGQAKDEAALIQLEHTWAEALERHDSAVVGCILAEEFEDVGVDGTTHGRDETLAHIPQGRPGSNRLSELKAHVHGVFGYVRGLNTVVDAQGKTVARVRFTDIFEWRNGRWMAVAGHETLLSEAVK